MDVVLLPWPTEDGRRTDLSHGRRPRLLLVEPGAAAPVVTDVLEDWVRLPVDDADLLARLTMLVSRTRSAESTRPRLDEDGVMRHRQSRVPLRPLEARLAASLLDRFGVVVHRDALTRAAWPAGTPGRNALDVHMLRLRRRIAPLGLTIRTVRGRGYLLDASDSGQIVVSGA